MPPSAREPMLQVLRSRHDIHYLLRHEWIKNHAALWKSGKCLELGSQNSSESNLMTALAVGGLTWLMGQRNSIGSVFPFQHASGHWLLLLGLSGTPPAQMGHGLWGQMEKEQQVHWQSQHMGKSERKRQRLEVEALNKINIHLVLTEYAPFSYVS